MKQRIYNGHPLEFYDDSNNKKAEIKVSGSDLILNPVDSSGTVIIGEDGAINDIEVGAVGTAVDFTFLGGGTITPNGSTLVLGEVGDTIDLSNATIGAITASAFVGTFIGDGTDITNIPMDLESYTGDVGVTGSLVVTGTITAQEFNTEIVSASILYESGSTKFGDTLDDTHSFTGSLQVSGGLTLPDGVLSDLALNFSSSANTGIYLGDYNSSTKQFNIVVDGGIKGAFNSAGITSTSNLYTSAAGSFRNYSGVWKATTGQAGGDAQFILNGKTIMHLDEADERVGIGTTSPTVALHVSKSTGFNIKTERAIEDGGRNGHSHFYTAGGAHIFGRPLILESSFRLAPTTPSNTTKHYRITNDSEILKVALEVGGSTTTNNILTVSGSKVGIGTATPDELFDIAGTARFETGIAEGTIYVGNDIQHWGDGGTGMFFGTDTVSLKNNSGETRLFIKSGGNVGLGTTNPNHKLDIYSNETIPLRVHRPSNANLNSTGSWGIGFSTRGDAVNSTSDTRAGIFSYYNGNLFLAANNTSIASDPFTYARVTIQSAGNVGIGTTSPAEKLEVVGYAKATTGFKAGSYTLLNESGNETSLSNSAYYPMFFKTNNSTRMTISNAGNVGIGTTSPSSKLEVYDSQNPTSGDITTSKIYSNGNVAANGNTRTGLDVETIRGGWYNSDTTAGNFKVSNANRIGNSDLIGVKSLATIDVDNVYSGVAAGGSLTALHGKVTTTFTAGSGPVAKGYGLRIDAPEVATSSEIATYYGAYIDGASVSGTLTNKYALVTEAAAGNVGIGTDSPNTRLHLRDVDSPYQIRLQSTGTETWNLGIGKTSYYDNTLLFQYGGDGDKMALTSTGKLGVGDLNPTARLVVVDNTQFASGQASVEVLRLQRKNTGGDIKATTEGHISMWATDSNTNTEWGRISWVNDNAGDGGLETEGAMSFWTSKEGDLTRAMYIDHDQQVGIGTTAPDATLKIVDASNSSTTSLSLNNRILFRGDGVMSWGSAAGHGQLNWSGNYALITGLSGKGLKFNVGGSSLALTLDTNLAATFTGNVITLGGLTVGDSTADTAQIGLKHLLGYCENTDVDTGTEDIKSLALSTYQAVFFDYVIKNGTNLRAGTLTAAHDGTNIKFNEVSTVDLGNTTDVKLKVVIDGSNMKLQATTLTDNWTIKANIRGIKV